VSFAEDALLHRVVDERRDGLALSDPVDVGQAIASLVDNAG